MGVVLLHRDCAQIPRDLSGSRARNLAQLNQWRQSDADARNPDQKAKCYHAVMLPRQHIFERRPHLSICALCGKTDDSPAGFIFEERPTGTSFALQTWGFCPTCWNARDVDERGADVEPEVVFRKYFTFLRRLLDGRSLRRAITTDRSFRILPR